MSYPSDAPPPPPPQPNTPPPEEDALQFDRATFSEDAAQQEQQEPVSTVCSACNQPIAEAYYAAGEHILCPACRDQILASTTGGSATRRLLRATVFGLLAGLAGGIVWYAVRKLTGYEIGLIAVVVGFAVGGAVRKGSDDRGGVAYQILAVFITYCCIVSTYVPEIYTAFANEPDAPPAAVVAIISILIAFIAPVYAGFENIIGILIIAFALWEAWKINKFRKIEFAGPFSIAGGTPAAPPPFPPPPSAPAPAGTT